MPRKRVFEPAPSGAPTASDGIKSAGRLAYVVRRDEAGKLRLAPAWPLWALLVGFPFWWAFGASNFIFSVLAIPMAVTLVRRRPLRYPRAWWVWAVFLVWMVLGLAMFNEPLPGTTLGSVGGRSISTATDFANYAGVTITLLFVGNLADRELPIPRLMRWLSFFFVTVVIGGLLGTFAPHLSFPSPIELVLPHSIRDIPYVHALVHPAVSQVQSLLGDGQNGRAAAPFPYTNTWANNISLLLVWFVCSWGLDGSAKRRWACGAVLAVSVIPIVYSLNRGLWIGIVFSVLWVAVRLFLRGKVAALLAVLAAAIAGLLAFVASPLHDTFQARLENQNSNGIRSYLSGQAVRGAIASPVLGWAGPRKTEGSDLSIAVGKTPQCQLCGAFSIGGNGQLWAVIFDRGFVGAALYFGFFAACLWLYRKDRSPPAQAATLVVALSFVYMFVYNAVPAALTLTMISIGVLWRSDEQRARRNQLALSPATTGAK